MPIKLKEHAAYAPIIQKHVVETEGERWGRLFCRWTEKTGTKTLEHIYAACIDLQSDEGDIYLDCSKRKIWLKFCALIVAYPICLTIKTAYHLALPISIPLEIFLTVSKAKRANSTISSKELAARSIKQIGKNMADIFRTPVYATALTAIGISAIIIGPLAPRALYTLRAAAGKVENALNWGARNHFWTLFRCFQPSTSLATIYKWDHFDSFSDTEYNEDHLKSTIVTGMTHFARSVVKNRKVSRFICNDFYKLHPADVAYVSSAAQV